MGDSYSDEYQFYPPDRAKARNWVEILARARGLDFGAFASGSRGQPRNQGFAQNWARNDAETADLIREGQHTGLARQVARGEVDVVIVFIGGNDFIHALTSEGRQRAVDEVLKRAIANLDLAVRTILEASPKVQVFIATLPDILELPMFAAPLRAGRLSPKVASAFSDAISRYNWHIRQSTMTNPRIALVDLALATRLAPRTDDGHVVVVGRRLDWIRPGNDPDHAFLADSRHISTLVQGLVANFVISALNARLDARIRPLGLREILAQDPTASAVASLDPCPCPGVFTRPSGRRGVSSWALPSAFASASWSVLPGYVDAARLHLPGEENLPPADGHAVGLELVTSCRLTLSVSPSWSWARSGFSQGISSRLRKPSPLPSSCLNRAAPPWNSSGPSLPSSLRSSVLNRFSRCAGVPARARFSLCSKVRYSAASSLPS